MRKNVFTAAILIFLASQAWFSQVVQAQTPEFRLSISRDFGYGNGSDIRGNFSMRIYGDQTRIKAVDFLLDGSLIKRIDQPPFELKFVTSDYPDGWHTLAAAVSTSDGQQSTTPDIRLNFVSADQQNQTMTIIFGLTFGLVIVITGIGLSVQFLLLRGKKNLPPGYQRNYGMLGGAICPRCGRPFAIHFWSLRLIVARFDRCDNCGKWAFVKRADPAELVAAEQAEKSAAQSSETQLPGAVPETDEEKLRRLMDESRYTH